MSFSHWLNGIIVKSKKLNIKAGRLRNKMFLKFLRNLNINSPKIIKSTGHKGSNEKVATKKLLM